MAKVLRHSSAAGVAVRILKEIHCDLRVIVARQSCSEETLSVSRTTFGLVQWSRIHNNGLTARLVWVSWKDPQGDACSIYTAVEP